MWVKLLLLLAYLLALFFVSRLLEAAAWYEAGFLPYRILDPFSLSVKKLKRLLETRGMSYVGLVEKQELSTLAKTSGDVTEGELMESENEEAENNLSPPKSTQFSGGSHFYEEVEDTKDSVWLVQVIPPKGSPFLGDAVWKKLQSQVAPFGVRTGIFDCIVDQRLCKRKGWHTPQLILAMPRGHRPKDNVIVHAYPYRSPKQPQPVIDWFRKHLKTRVHEVRTMEEMRTKWLQFNPESKESEVRVLFLSVLLEPPLFLLALGVKFSGRIRVGMMQIKENSKDKKELNELVVTNNTAYLVVTPERIFVYGQRMGEYLTYRRMELFLKTLRPEVNDVFIVSLVLVNLIGSLNLLFVSIPLWRHIISCFWHLAKANCLLFLIWLFLLAISSFPFMDSISEHGLWLLRLLSGSEFAALLRDEWHKWRSSLLGLSLSFFAFCSCLSYVWSRFRPRDASPESASSGRNVNEWWSVSLDSYLMDCFFRPIASLTQPMAPSDLDLEEGMELLIERLAVPNLWLQPVISNDYIKELPLWSYRSLQTKDFTSDYSESDVKSSEDEDVSCKQIKQKLTFEKDELKRVKVRFGQVVGSEAPSGTIACHQCAICLDQYRDGVVLCGLPCGHSYHDHCILLWLSRDNHHCPICRWPSYKSKSQPNK